jgi:hypothetical protein
MGTESDTAICVDMDILTGLLIMVVVIMESTAKRIILVSTIRKVRTDQGQGLG